MSTHFALGVASVVVMSMVTVGMALGEEPLAASELNIADFGVAPDSGSNATPAVRKALDACKAGGARVLVFPRGRYDFWPEGCVERDYYMSNTTDVNPKRCGILVEGITDLVIEGSGSTFVFHDRISPFVVDHSSGIKIRNLAIDWDRPLTSQAEVADVTDTHIDLRIDPVAYPYVIERKKLVFTGKGWESRWWGVMEFDRETRRIPPQSGDGTLGSGWNAYEAEEIEPGLVRLKRAFKRKPAKGNILVLRHCERDHAGMFLFHGKDLEVSNVDVYHTAGLGILSQYCENIHLDRASLTPNREKGRYFSGHDDGAHFSNCRGRILVENCSYAGLMDDPINVHGTSVAIVEKRSPNTLIVRFMHHQSVGMMFAQPGDTIAFIDSKTMTTVGEGKAKSVRAIDTKDLEIVLEGDAPEEIVEGDALENLTWTPDVEIRGCSFGSCRARGVLISTPGKVVIEDNVFESSGSAILIAGDANQWYESGAVRDVLIRGNRFEDSCLTSMYQFCEAIISICPEIPDMAGAPRPYHRNIRIENNTFRTYDYPVLFARSVEDLTFKDNAIARGESTAQPFHPRKYTLSFEACRNAKVSGTKFEGDVLGKNIHTDLMQPADLVVEADQGFVEAVGAESTGR